RHLMGPSVLRDDVRPGPVQLLRRPISARRRRGGILSGYSVLPRPLVSRTTACARNFTLYARPCIVEHPRLAGRGRAPWPRRTLWTCRLAMALPDRGSARRCLRHSRAADADRTSVGCALALIRRKGLAGE